MSRDRVDALWRTRPRDRFVRLSFAALAAAVVAACFFGGLDWGGLFGQERAANWRRFLAEVRPFPLQGRDFDLGLAVAWALDLWRVRGGEALAATLFLAVAASVLAFVAGLLFAFPAARNWSRPDPFAGSAARWPAARTLWFGLYAGTRVLLILLRSMPEYVLAFLLVALVGPGAWPVLLALALHNTGVLGRLQADLVEDVDAQGPRALAGVGAGRFAVAGFAIVPALLPRFLLFFFYRFETCVREATVLGLLGWVSLGFWVADARARAHTDELLFFVVLGGVLVGLADVLSDEVRGRLSGRARS
ncbi:MAG: ABC transporter permease subunit [Proteobacteria bacterium]|nr:ABC transporter permease subunit [Pseudomonadota bacterium]